MNKLTIKQGDPVSYMAFKWATKAGKPYKYGSQRSAPALLIKALNRYSSGMTVGHGNYKMYIATDQPNSPCSIYGAFSDGRLLVNLPGGGCAVLGTSDIQITDCSPLTAEEREFIKALPVISLIQNDEIIDMQGNLIGGKPTHPKP